MSQLENLLQQCTVKLSLPGQMGWGTGFFVAPEWILTCAHVVKGAKGEPVQVWWQKQENWSEAVVEDLLPDPYDLALLRVKLPPDTNPPCVYLDGAIQSRDPLYLFGYPDQDFPNGCPVTLNCEGLTGDEPGLIKFALGQVRPGMSGAPLLNQRTGKVCGIVKFTRDRSFDLGGGAVPTAAILEKFPQLREFQEQFYQRDRRWRDLEPKPSLTRQEYHNRQALLTKVNNFWVKSVLEKSLYNQVIIEFWLEERPDAITNPWSVIIETDDSSPQPLPDGTKIIDIFDQIGTGRTLLILGEPGSGKTTSLLELTRDLIFRAEQNINLPIPVVFNLSTWANELQKIEDWLVEELNDKYYVSKKIGLALVTQQQLLPLLDGLDEVKAEYRDDCIAALNQFQQDYGAELVVCSRIKDYEALSNRLNFQSAVYIRLLTLEQIYNYLDSVGAELAGLRTLIVKDTILQELTQSPLMLNIVTLAYQGVAVEDLPKTEVLEERRRQLFDDYIEKMFKRRGVSQRYSKEQARYWLIWLAQRMRQESKTVFLIEKMHTFWLTKRNQKTIYILVLILVFVVIGGLIGSPLGDLIPGVFYGLSYGLLPELIVGSSKACIKHFSLRLILYCNNYIPWNYARFLDYAADRIFLQKVGGGYIFIHRMLMEHFAQMECDRSR